ncbi:MAG: L-serine ammonia-lyase [Desulfovibrio sp.]
MTYITTSVFELFKIGPGPSSSHTIGPMNAGYDFLQNILTLDAAVLNKADQVAVHLYGSLSATGKGHGTDKAVLAGILGQKPELCTSQFLEDLKKNPKATYDFPCEETQFKISLDNIIFDAVQNEFPFSNTMVIKLKSGTETLFEREYYSIGGGFIKYKGQPDDIRGFPTYPYRTMAELKDHLLTEGIRLHKLVLDNEIAITGKTKQEIYDDLDRIIDVMEGSVEAGLAAKGRLPGSLGLKRKAHQLFAKANKYEEGSPNYFMIRMNSYAFAAAEENATGHIIVTAPTSGSAGVIPAIIYAMKHHYDISRKNIRKGMLAAAAIGFLAKNNASIAGAEVGCQGEVGVASSMGAALLAYATGSRFRVTENAAESALEHHLGLTCDPVGGYVQVPCIERNAMGAIKAYNAYLIAKVVDPSFHIVDLDKAICAMAATGKDMPDAYKETSLGGLAVSVPEC